MSLPSVDVTIAVYDVSGRKIFLPTIFSNDKVQISTSDLPEGFYTLQATSSKTGEVEAGKFVKQLKAVLYFSSHLESVCTAFLRLLIGLNSVC